MRARITKSEWLARGGLRNSRLYRRKLKGSWLYYISVCVLASVGALNDANACGRFEPTRPLAKCSTDTECESQLTAEELARINAHRAGVRALLDAAHAEKNQTRKAALLAAVELLRSTRQ